MNEEEKEIIERIQQDSTFRERSLLRIIEKQQTEIETLKRDFEIVDHECSRLEQEDIKKDKIINEIKKENHDLKEKLQMFIPRRRVRRIYKMLGKILSVDIDPIILEKELKAEYKIKEDK